MATTTKTTTSTSSMKSRSHHYHESDHYVDKTQYDTVEMSLDVGYQRLKFFQINRYPNISSSSLTKLFVDHNSLTELPKPLDIPHLIHLSCSWNRLTSIPLYPKLTNLICNFNQITTLQNYHKSGLTYVDMGHNSKLQLNFLLDRCTDLFINHNDLRHLDISKFAPNVQVLDCSFNQLTQLNGGQKLVELCIQNNSITRLTYFPHIQRLMADNNSLGYIQTFPQLSYLTAPHNKIIRIDDQPYLKRMIVDHNSIVSIGKMPIIEVVDLSYNNLTSYDVGDRVEFLSLQHNPVHEIHLSKNSLRTIKEIQMHYKLYTNFYEKYYDNMTIVTTQISEERLDQAFNGDQADIFSPDMKKILSQKFCNIEFNKREEKLERLCIRLTAMYLNQKISRNDPKYGKHISHLKETQQYSSLLYIITYLYCKSLVFTLYFNGHC